VHAQDAYRWFWEGKAAGARAVSGRTVRCARVSHDQRLDLDRQMARLARWAAALGHEVGEMVAEVGSGLGGAARSCGGCCRIRLRGWWSWSTVTGWRGSGRGACRPRVVPMAGV